MKKTFVFFALAATVLAACTKEQPISDGPVVKTVLSIGSAETKTTVGDVENDGTNDFRRLFWADGDNVAANGVASLALENVPAGTTRADFSFSETVTAPYNVVYPASIYRNDTPSIKLPHNAGDQVIPMGGRSQTASFSLNPLTGILQLKIKQAASDPDTDNIVLIEVSTASTRMSGDFTIDYAAGTISPFDNPVGNDLSVQITGDWALSSTERSFFIPVPAGSYGFTVKVMDSQGHYMTKTTTGAKTFTKGVIQPLKAFEFVPSASDCIEIENPQQLIAFATAYNRGDYAAQGQDLVVIVTDDLVFDATSSAAFNETEGIGKPGTGGLFNGVFNGNNHTISGLTATVPLFARTGAYGTVKNLTIDNSCSFTFTHFNTAELDAGAVVGYHKGTLDNVTVAADVSLSAVSDVGYDTCLGGIVGRVKDGGIVKDSQYTGALSVPAGFQAAANRVMIGGVVGWISETGGIVQDSDFEGTLGNQGQMIASEESDEQKINPYLMIGGIVGLNQGTVDYCSAANHATGVTVTLSGNNYTGTVVTHSTNAYHYAIAGIAGRNNGTVSGCTNNATVLNIFSAERGASGNLNGRYLNVAGIVGYNAAGATVSGGTNNGIIIDRASPKIHYVGGVIGRNHGAVSTGVNSSSGDITVGTSHFDGPYGARQMYLGGGIGYNESTGTIAGLTNGGDLTINALEDNNTVICAMGGVVGESKTAINGSEAVITNSGKILEVNANQKVTSENRSSTNHYGHYLGGIVGFTTAGVSNVSNTGNIEYQCYSVGSDALEGGARYIYLGGVAAMVWASALVDVQYCTNSGNLLFNPTQTAPHNTGSAATYARYSNCYLGGIVGNGELVRIKGDATTKTTNSGNVQGGDTSGNTKTTDTFYVGGIAGRLYGKGCTVSYCDITGSAEIYNCHWSNALITSFCPMCGGIVGYIYGANSTVSNCTLASTANVLGTRGRVGGIVGYGRAVTITNCTVSRDFSGQSAYSFGGIVSWLYNGTVKDCTYSGSKIRTSQLQEGGGIVAFLNGSTIDSCSSSVTDVSKNGTAVTATGALAGSSDASSTIKNSHYKSAKQICGDSNFSTPAGEENAADL